MMTEQEKKLSPPPPLCINLRAGLACVSVCKAADVLKAGLVVSVILLKGRWRVPELHLTAEILKIGDHGQRQAKLLTEEFLSWPLAAHTGTRLGAGPGTVPCTACALNRLEEYATLNV